jgi:hypothetical protein
MSLRSVTNGRAHEPASGTTVAYRQSWNARSRVLGLRFESTAPGAGRAEILLPPGAAPLGLRVDGQPRPLPVVRVVGEDRYAVVETDWKKHSLELALR